VLDWIPKDELTGLIKLGAVVGTGPAKGCWAGIVVLTCCAGAANTGC